MQSKQVPSVSSSAPAQSEPTSQSWGFQQPPQPILSGLFPATIPPFAGSGNFYQQQLQQQLRQQLPHRQSGQPSQLQPQEQLAGTPDQRYQSLLQQQAASSQPAPALSSLLQALKAQAPLHQAQAPVQSADSGTQLQQQRWLQLQSTQPAQPHSAVARPPQPVPAQLQTSSTGVRPQPATHSIQPNERPVLTRFTGPANASFQLHSLGPRTSLQQSSSHTLPSVPSAPAAQQQAPIQPQRSAQEVWSAAPSSSVTTPATSAAAAPRPAAIEAIQSVPAASTSLPARLHAPTHAVTAADEVGEEAQPLKPPRPGRVVWAKLARFPWWPAEVLDLSDSYIPEGEEPPRLGAVPVRFFGTYAFSWIESKRAIEPFDDEHMEHASSSRQPEFQRGVTEAKHFQLTGELPQGFTLALQQFYEEQQKVKAKSAAKGGKSAEDSKDTSSKGGKKGLGKRHYDDPVAAEHARHRAVTARRLRILRHLGLSPPAGSPFASAHAACLDGFGPVAAQMGYVMPTAAQ